MTNLLITPGAIAVLIIVGLILIGLVIQFFSPKQEEKVKETSQVEETSTLEDRVFKYLTTSTKAQTIQTLKEEGLDNVTITSTIANVMTSKNLKWNIRVKHFVVGN